MDTADDEVPAVVSAPDAKPTMSDAKRKQFEAMRKKNSKLRALYPPAADLGDGAGSFVTERPVLQPITDGKPSAVTAAVLKANDASDELLGTPRETPFATPTQTVLLPETDCANTVLAPPGVAPKVATYLCKKCSGNVEPARALLLSDDDAGGDETMVTRNIADVSVGSKRYAPDQEKLLYSIAEQVARDVYAEQEASRESKRQLLNVRDNDALIQARQKAALERQAKFISDLSHQ